MIDPTVMQNHISIGHGFAYCYPHYPEAQTARKKRVRKKHPVAM